MFKRIKEIIKEYFAYSKSIEELKKLDKEILHDLAISESDFWRIAKNKFTKRFR